MHSSHGESSQSRRAQNRTAASFSPSDRVSQTPRAQGEVLQTLCAQRRFAFHLARHRRGARIGGVPPDLIEHLHQSLRSPASRPPRSSGQFLPSAGHPRAPTRPRRESRRPCSSDVRRPPPSSAASSPRPRWHAPHGAGPCRRRRRQGRRSRPALKGGRPSARVRAGPHSAAARGLRVPPVLPLARRLALRLAQTTIGVRASVQQEQGDRKFAALCGNGQRRLGLHRPSSVAPLSRSAAQTSA